MQQGMLPNLESLSKEGCFNRLGTTLPALSPVAWSTFQTGVNPGAHNIFDFLTRDKRTCMPEMASTEIVKRARSFLGKLLFPKRKKEEVRITRRSKPFWSLLGERGIFSNVIRVPISYPPEKFNGNLLSAMCTPDLRGSQGTFSYFTTEKKSGAQDAEGGERYPLETNGSALKGRLCGPPEQGSKGLIAVDFWIS
ncbi:MAG: nucleotide pyrophosphatase, partial [Proteobacteria bacterium]